MFFFVLPGFIIYSVFFAGPTVAALFLSFTDWNGIAPTFNYVGFSNYTNMLTDDPIFVQSLGNNLKFTLGVLIFQTVLSLFFAMLLVKNTKANIFYRAVYFFPTIVASVSVAFVWTFMYDPNIGVINNLLSAVGLESLAKSWLGDRNIAIYSLAFVQFWAHTGQMLIIFVAGLHAIPKELYEAAEIEGASKWQTFKSITWPLLAPSATIVVAYTTIQSFKAFDLVIAMTGGGPSYATEILSTFLYHEAFINFRFGYASAAAVIFMIIIAIVTVLQFRLLKSNDVKF
ncbi:carbohydrate ABC transporter permease [Bacillus sp. RAR_GA_16]|uniref:carbohydrate ABC transporter permease n=1 Tax=Bacillus sp. RAR_GA_16 TaxID=2876774 RepID=UPI001CCF363C|nr:sugar ABC transporter permease [Bacillus sp. RAR_GA_16]MCA0172203.1 sugar ABC transporter permease [Bacillus sp. RAR_GA_16]